MPRLKKQVLLERKFSRFTDMATIQFLPNTARLTRYDTVSFEVVLDGEKQTCEIAHEALSDFAGTDRMKGNELVPTFHAHWAKIEDVARKVLPKRLAATHRGLLTSMDF